MKTHVGKTVCFSCACCKSFRKSVVTENEGRKGYLSDSFVSIMVHTLTSEPDMRQLEENFWKFFLPWSSIFIYLWNGKWRKVLSYYRSFNLCLFYSIRFIFVIDTFQSSLSKPAVFFFFFPHLYTVNCKNVYLLCGTFGIVRVTCLRGECSKGLPTSHHSQLVRTKKWHSCGLIKFMNQRNILMPLPMSFMEVKCPFKNSTFFLKCSPPLKMAI